jgi:hypothetical protein
MEVHVEKSGREWTNFGTRRREWNDGLFRMEENRIDGQNSPVGCWKVTMNFNKVIFWVREKSHR